MTRIVKVLGSMVVVFLKRRHIRTLSDKLEGYMVSACDANGVLHQMRLI